ncbi:nucleoside phosphorylase [Halorussus gelatinilyticus]|uniref:Nucleoside phosphorylase n=1 Tax=Halorussus gelatinilyticus TaxID=2937524 RepID=A0A8U0IKU7_9EURY|nr:nucleoside phosphorylase [Halorussus gelatinilyticus]UPW01760.1 nucleoside phosphorylase [Halorussus gelatinilyticus]
MTFPNLPDKHGAEPLVTPEEHADYRASQADGDVAEPPEAVVLCYSRGLMDYLMETYAGETVDHYYGQLYCFEDTDYSVGVMGNFGIGAPTAVMLLDELIADDVEAFLSVGIAGCLDESVEMGEFVVPDRAIRDEGTSHHYVESETYAYPSDELLDATTELLDERGEPFHVGPTWTTDAIYRETKREIERYAAEGVLTVEMEASAVFAVADYRGVDAGAMFVVSDYLGLSDWEPKFHLTSEDVQKLGDTAKDVLTEYVE